jgi:hypothetical protein
MGGRYLNRLNNAAVPDAAFDRTLLTEDDQTECVSI